MSLRRLLALVAIFALLALTFGCGSSNTGTGGNNNTGGATQQVVITVGDDPVSRILSFSLTLESVKLAPTSGDVVTVVSTPVNIELTQLAGTAFPLGTASIPQETYKGAQIVVSHPVITLMDPSTGQPVQKVLPPDPRTVNVVFNPPVTVGSTPAEIHFDMNLLGSITVDAAGNVTFTPNMIGSMPPPPSATNPIRHIMGTVKAINGTSFTLTTLMGQKDITFATDSNTKFTGDIASLSQMQVGMLAVVDATLGADGKPLAVVVAAKMMPTGVVPIGLEGIVFKVKSDATGFQMILQGGIGPVPTPMAMPGLVVNVTVSNTTVFKVDDDGVDLTGITVPPFDASTLKPGQRVRVASTINLISATPMMGMPAALFTAEKVELVQQGLFGVVSNYDSSSNKFTLTVPLDSVLHTVTGTAATVAVTLTVHKQPGTVVKGTIANGSTVLVRGLLLNGGSNYFMVSTTILVPPSPTT